MRKPDFCFGKNKGSVTAKLISAFVFAIWIVQFFYFLNPKFPASSLLLQLYMLVCVGNPEAWFSHVAAQLSADKMMRKLDLCMQVCEIQRYRPTVRKLPSWLALFKLSH